MWIVKWRRTLQYFILLLVTSVTVVTLNQAQLLEGDSQTDDDFRQIFKGDGDGDPIDEYEIMLATTWFRVTGAFDGNIISCGNLNYFVWEPCGERIQLCSLIQLIFFGICSRDRTPAHLCGDPFSQ